MQAGDGHREPSLVEITREWGRIGCVGFGGPPAHIALLRKLCVQDRQWLTSAEFERAIAATSLLPGPASTQLAIYCGWRLRGGAGALLAGAGFIVPGLLAILVLSALFLSGSPPAALRGAGAGAGAAVAAVAVSAGLGVARPMWERTRRTARGRTLAYGLAGALTAAASVTWLVLVLLACGAAELAVHARARTRAGTGAWFSPALLALAGAVTRAPRSRLVALPLLGASAQSGGTAALAWTAFKVGALAFGGGFVIVPLMQADAVSAYHWMTHTQFLNAVALGQVTPGPVTHTIAAVGYSAGGVPGALFAAAIAFAPSFAFILIGAARFERLLVNERVRVFLAGAAPAATGAIIGAAVPLTGALVEGWQFAVLGAAAIALLALRRGVVLTLLLAGCAGLLVGVLGGPLPQ